MTASAQWKKVTLPGEEHRHAGLARSVHDLLVAHRATRLHDRRDSGVDQHLGPIREREEGIGRRDRSGGALPRTLDREAARVDAVDLAHADTHRGVVLRESTIAFDLTARHAFQAKMRFSISSSLGRSPETSSQFFATETMSSGKRSASCSS